MATHPPRRACRKGAHRMRRWHFTGALAVLLPFGTTVAAEPAVRFDRDVLPVLARCVQCHGPGKARAGLRLDNRDGALGKTESGARAIVPGHPEQSELLRRVTEKGERRMPPKGE